VNVSFPLRGEIQAVAKNAGLPYSDAVRDIVRLVAVAQLCSKSFLNEDCVLVGGMALRLRGSSRFTIFDTDSSTRRTPISEQDIADGLSFTADELEISPEDPAYWTRSKKLRTAQPVKYKAFFAGTATVPIEDEFSLTVNERGLMMPPEWFDLLTPYPSLIFDPVPPVPVMHVVEQTAEKILGWCGNSLAKHYLDLGWIARDCLGELDAERLREQCEVKLRINKELFEDFERFNGVDDLVEPLDNPDRYFGPLNRDRDRRETGIRFLDDPMSLEEAKAHIRKGILPLLSG
jgi:hypothetical protein